MAFINLKKKITRVQCPILLFSRKARSKNDSMKFPEFWHELLYYIRNWFQLFIVCSTQEKCWDIDLDEKKQIILYLLWLVLTCIVFILTLFRINSTETQNRKITAFIIPSIWKTSTTWTNILNLPQLLS